MQHGFFKGCFIDNEKFPELNNTLEKIGEKYGVTKTTMAFCLDSSTSCKNATCYGYDKFRKARRLSESNRNKNNP